MTVNSPFSPQAHATAPFGWCSTIRMPSGNGMPRKNPRGKMSAAPTAMRTASDEARKWSNKPGYRNANAATASTAYSAGAHRVRAPPRVSCSSGAQRAASAADRA